MTNWRLGLSPCVTLIFLLWFQAVAAAPVLDTREGIAADTFSKGRYTQAVVHYQRLLRQQPENIGYRVRLAESYENSGKLELAEEHATEVIQKQSKNVEALMIIGRIRGRQGDWASAKAFYDRAIQADKNNATAHLNMGQALMQLGKRDEAEAEFIEYGRLTGVTQP